MAKQPSYPMYAQDFDMDTADWENEEVGVYVRLLNYEWINGSLPHDTKRLARIVRISHKKFQKNWKKISKKFFFRDINGDQILQNSKMENVREEINNYLKKQRESGRKGAEKRWGKDSDPNGEPIATPMANGCLSFSSSYLKESSSLCSEDSSPEPPKSSGESKVILTVPLIKKDGEFEITENMIKEYKEAFPGIDVLAELRKLKIWNQDNPQNRKTRGGFKRHVLGWLSRAQNRAPRVNGVSNYQPKGGRALDWGNDD